jgi:exopolysaccharide biosynthesis polyprenyl glycosylphosphotransferase
MSKEARRETIAAGARVAGGPSPAQAVVLDAIQLTDLASLGLALAVAPWVAMGLGVTPLEALRETTLSVADALLVAAALVFGHFALRGSGAYASACDPLSLRKLARASAGALFWAIFSGGGALLLGAPWANPGGLVALALTAVGGTAATRHLWRLVVRSRSASVQTRRNVLIVGTGAPARRFAESIETRPETGCRVVGFCDDFWPGMAEFQQSGRHVVCDPKNFPNLLRDEVVDELVIALPVGVVQRYRRSLLGTCAARGIPVRFLAGSLDELLPEGLPSPNIGDGVVFSLPNSSIEGWPAVAKRAMDMALSLSLLALASPFLLSATVLVAATSPGPVFFVQERVGRGRRRFRMYKFRTMKADAEGRLGEIEHLNEVEGPVFKIENDPRLTRAGRLLRKTSIDELPQLANVLVGHMSLVGPRPLPVRDVEGFEDDLYDRRFSIRPGLTGLWQVSGRCAVPFHRWMDLDLRYVDSWSLGLDLQILLRTIPAVLSGRGAR